MAFNFWPWWWYSMQNYVRMSNQIVHGMLNVESMCALAHADIPLLPPGYRLVMVLIFRWLLWTVLHVIFVCQCIVQAYGCGSNVCVFLSATTPFTSSFLGCSLSLSLILIYLTLSVHRSHSRRRCCCCSSVCMYVVLYSIFWSTIKCIFVLSRSNFLFDA